MSLNGQLKISGNRSVRQIIGRVAVASGTPSVAVGEDFSVTDVAAGKVKVTLSKPGRSIIGVSAVPFEATDTTAHFVKVLAKTEASDVTFGVFVADATDGALVDDVGFYFTITVKDVG